MTRFAQSQLGLKVDGIWGPSTQAAYLVAPSDVRGRIDRLFSEQSLSAYSVARVTSTVREPGGSVQQRRNAEVVRTQAPVRKGGRMSYVADEALIRRSLNEAKITGVSQENFIIQAKRESSLVANARERMPSASFARRNLRSFLNMSVADIEAIRRQGERVFFETAYGHLTSKGRELGNNLPGHGYDMRGAGAIQVTGYSNWLAFERFSGIPITTQPGLMNQASVAMAASIWFWQKRVGGAAIDLATIRRIVNPGLV